MATVSYNGQSFSIGSRRIWLVSGSIHYARTPRGLWRSRIRAAKQAGLNCIETFVFWNLHEPRPGQFVFEGDLDLRHFIDLIGQEGMYCILRPGPYVGGHWDFGGLPAWLHRVDKVRLRQANGPFLEACARYLGAVLEQVKDLQVTSSSPGYPLGGPIVMMQTENHWYCDHPKQAQTYLMELARYLREYGCEVPICDCNKLWSRLEAVIATWNESTHLASDLRQLRVVQPNAPRIVTEYWTGRPDRWAGEPPARITPVSHEYRLASILAVGAQFNLSMFHGGTNFGFNGGRGLDGPFDFVTTGYSEDFPLSQAGTRGEKYQATKRVCTFASQFSQLFAHLEPDHHHACLLPRSEHGHDLAVVHQRGSQGHVVFLLKGQQNKSTVAPVLLPNGTALTVPIGSDRVAWFVIEANLGGGATLDYTNLRPWAFINKRTLVLFGPAGADGVVCINGSPVRMTVPKDRAPVVTSSEGLTIVVLNRQQVDSAYPTASGLVLGADELDEQDQPVVVQGRKRVTVIEPGGTTRQQSIQAGKSPVSPRLSAWKQVSLTSWLDGSSEQYQPIDGPASLESLGVDQGYGWYRLNFRAPARGKALIAEAADRLHLYRDQRSLGVVGDGPGTVAQPASLSLGGGVVALADNMGRFSHGWQINQPKGWWGHAYDVAPVKLAKPKVTQEHAPDLFKLEEFVPFARWGERPVASTCSWKIKPKGKKPLIVQIDGLPLRAMLLVNGEPVGAYDPVQTCGRVRWVLQVGQQIRAGQNELKLAFFDRLDVEPVKSSIGSMTRLLKHVTVFWAVNNLTAKASWAFAPWGLPDEDLLEPVSGPSNGLPCWYRSRFNVSRTDVPLWLNLAGMTKGVFYLNGHHVGRYFIATAQRQSVGPTKQYYLPEPWLRTDQPNDLWLFDEHGHKPTRCQLRFGRTAP